MGKNNPLQIARNCSKRNLDNIANNTYQKNTLYFTKLNAIITSYKDKGFNELLGIINERLNEKYTKETLFDLIKEMHKSFSVGKTEELEVLLNIAVARDENNKEDISKNKARLLIIDKNINSFYKTISENKDKGFNELVDIINEKYLGNFSKKDIIFLYMELKKSTVTLNKAEIITIINMAVARDNNQPEKVMIGEAKLKMIEVKRQSKKKEENVVEKPDHIDKQNDVNDLMKRVVNGEELKKEDDVIREIQYAKRNLKSIDKELYVDFIIKYCDVKSLTKKELDELIETVSFFKKNIQENYAKFKAVDSSKKEEINKLNNIQFEGVDKLDESTIVSAKKLYNWKKTRLKNENILFDKYLKILIQLKNNEEIEELKNITSGDIALLNQEYEFLKDYYSIIRKYYTTYKMHIKGINTINDEEVNKLKKDYRKKLIKDHE